MTRKSKWGAVLLGGPFVALAYMRVMRPWQLTWGATPDEVARAMPGDDLVERPSFCATRAITIAAPPERVFPWLVQVGVHRGGWYSYDWLDNLGRPSARRIHPEFQRVEPGQLLPMSPDGKHGIRIYSLDAPTEMIWGTPGDTTWVVAARSARGRPDARRHACSVAVPLDVADDPLLGAARVRRHLDDAQDAAQPA
ncbi:MAG: hypothetical protein M3312_01080 [Actinomycetota bacterium]|nr:hypothetical protein [Actinomycetota bacterium]